MFERFKQRQKNKSNITIKNIKLQKQLPCLRIYFACTNSNILFLIALLSVILSLDGVPSGEGQTWSRKRGWALYIYMYFLNYLFFCDEVTLYLTFFCCWTVLQ